MDGDGRRCQHLLGVLCFVRPVHLLHQGSAQPAFSMESAVPQEEKLRGRQRVVMYPALSTLSR